MTRALTAPVVVFDMDGVLVDSFAVMQQAFEHAYGVVIGAGRPPFEEYHRHQGRYFPDIMDIMGLPRAMEGPYMARSAELVDTVRVFDGVPDVVEVLRQRGYRLAVATGKSHARATDLLRRRGLLDLFDVVLGSDQVARPKPAPDLVLCALDQLRGDPSRSIMIGDAVNDLRAARGAGIGAVAATWAGVDVGALRAERPDAILHRPDDVLEICPPLRIVAVV